MSAADRSAEIGSMRDLLVAELPHFEGAIAGDYFMGAASRFSGLVKKSCCASRSCAGPTYSATSETRRRQRARFCASLGKRRGVSG